MGPELNAMLLVTLDIPPEYVLSLSGDVGPAQVPQLRARLVEAVNRADSDILIDTHHVTAFDDAALAALTAARKRARFLRHRILILDAADGHVARSLCRAGMHIRMPAYPDAATAAQHLAADREARARLTLTQKEPSGLDPARGAAPVAPPDHGRVTQVS